MIEDDWVKSSIIKEREKVLSEQNEFIQIAAKYP
jgi:hypothetical protein